MAESINRFFILFIIYENLSFIIIISFIILSLCRLRVKFDKRPKIKQGNKFCEYL